MKGLCYSSIESLRFTCLKAAAYLHCQRILANAIFYCYKLSNVYRLFVVFIILLVTQTFVLTTIHGLDHDLMQFLETSDRKMVIYNITSNLNGLFRRSGQPLSEKLTAKSRRAKINLTYALA